MEERARLVEIEHDRKITKETDSQFLFEYQRAVLLSLRADGLLDETQYLYAEERLMRRMREPIKNQDDSRGRGETPW